MKQHDFVRDKHLRGSIYHRITANIPTTSQNKQVKEAIDFVLSNIHTFASINYLYIVDKNEKLKGVVSIKELFSSPQNKKLADVMVEKVFFVHPHSRQEKATVLALKHNIKAVPVVDQNGVFIGAVTSDTLLDILNQEATEDILHLSGTYVGQQDFSKLSPWRLALARLPWIGVGVVGGTLAGLVISIFSKTIETLVLLSIFIPLMMGTSGNIGAQSAVIFVRGLALEKLPLAPFMLKELQVGSVMGIIAALFMIVVSYLWYGSIGLSVIVAVSLFANSLLAVIIGVTIPWLLSLFKLDPAIGTAPFVTSIKDITSLVVYLGIATLVLFLLSQRLPSGFL